MLFLNDVHFLFGMVSVFLFYRLTSIVVLPHKVFDGITMWLPPQGPPPTAGDKKKGNSKKQKASAMMAPLEVPKAIIRNHCLLELPQWPFWDVFCAMSFVALLTMGFSEFYICFTGSEPGNASKFLGFVPFGYASFRVIRAMVAGGFCSYESRISFILATAAALFSGLLLWSDTLDIEMEQSFARFQTHVNTKMKAKNLAVELALPTTAFKAALVVLSFFVALVLVLPAFRVARNFHHIYSGNLMSWPKEWVPLYRTLAVLSFFVPLITALFWIKPLTAEMILSGTTIPRSAFESARLWLCGLPLVFAFFTFRFQLQAYFDGALQECTEMGNSETIRPLLNAKLSNALQYLPSVALQQAMVPVTSLLLLSLVKQWTDASTGVCSIFVDWDARRAAEKTPSPSDPSPLSPAILQYMFVWINLAWFSLTSLALVRVVYDIFFVFFVFCFCFFVLFIPSPFVGVSIFPVLGHLFSACVCGPLCCTLQMLCGLTLLSPYLLLLTHPLPSSMNTHNRHRHHTMTDLHPGCYKAVTCVLMTSSVILDITFDTTTRQVA